MVVLLGHSVYLHIGWQRKYLYMDTKECKQNKAISKQNIIQ